MRSNSMLQEARADRQRVRKRRLGWPEANALQHGIGTVRVRTDELSRDLPVVKDATFLAIIERPSVQCLAV